MNIEDFGPRAKLSYERVRAVLDGRRPDRVPFSDSYWAEFRARYLRDRGLPEGTSLAEHFDHDLVVMVPTMGPWPSLRGTVGHDSDGHVLKRDDFGLITSEIQGTTTMSRQVEARIKQPRDLDRFPFEDAGDDERTDGMARALPEACQRFCPVLKLGGPFSRTWRLRGLQQFLEDLARDEAFAQEMVGRMTEHLIAVGLVAVERMSFPPVLLHLADDFASTGGPLFSPSVYERVFLPNLRKLVDAFHDRGFKVSYESEGNVWPMLDLLDESGIDGLAHMEPRAGLRIERIRERFGSRFFFWSNVCNVAALPSGQPERIRDEVARVLSAATDGGYMGLSAHSIGGDVSSNAYDYFWELMDRYARYPIDLDALRHAEATLRPSGADSP